VTHCAVGLRVDVVFFNKLLAQCKLLFFGVQSPSEIRNLFDRPDVGGWVTVTVDAPSHGLILGLVNNLHLVNSTVAGHTRYATSDVDCVVKINIIR
jgi:hypothetical protein